MPYLIAALVIVSALCVLNLLLTYGVIRRLREHGELLARGAQNSVPELVARPGSAVGAFRATTVDGAELTADDLVPGALVGFFSPHCRACGEQLPKFLDVSAAHPGGRERALAVVVGAGEDAAAQAAALSAGARVVVAPPGAGIEEAFGVKGYPAFALLGEHRVVVASGMLSAIAGAAAEAVA